MKARDFFELDARQNSWAHAYLIIGKNDIKIKELIEYIVEQKKCLPADISTVVPENLSGKKGEIKIEQIKQLLHEINLSPLGSCRIAIVHNCERLNQSSGNILLKTLEEPPRHATFVLLAENNSVLSTIKSRCRIISIPNELNENSEEENNYIDIIESDFFTASREIEKIVKKYTKLVTLWNGEAYDVQLKKDQTKAVGLRHVMEIFNLKKEDVMAIGDNYNDQELLEESGMPISADKTRVKGKFYVPLQGEFLPADILMQKVLELKEK